MACGNSSSVVFQIQAEPSPLTPRIWVLQRADHLAACSFPQRPRSAEDRGIVLRLVSRSGGAFDSG